MAILSSEAYNIYTYIRGHAVCEPVLTILFGRGAMHFKRKLTHARVIVPVSRTNWRFADEKISWKKNVSVRVPPRDDYNIILYSTYDGPYNYYYYADCRPWSSAAACRPCSRRSDRAGFADSIFTRCRLIRDEYPIPRYLYV